MAGICVQAERGSSLKLIIMSATLDAAAFARYFGGTKIVYIQVSYVPLDHKLYTPGVVARKDLLYHPTSCSSNTPKGAAVCDVPSS